MSDGETIETGRVHFSVDGEGFTNLVRNMVLSERPGSAWRLIANGLMGAESEKVARGVLDGTMKLINAPDDCLEAVEDDDAESYLRDLRYIYAGRVRMDGTWWRPVAVIGLFGPESGTWAMRGWDKSIPAQTPGGNMLRAWSDRRASFFAGPNERAILSEERREYVIWETCAEIPFWLEPNITLVEALADSEKAERRLDARGEGLSSYDIVEAMEDDPDISYDEMKETRRLQEDADAILRQEQYEARVVEIGEKVREQAGDDTFVLVVPADERDEDAREAHAAFTGESTEPKPERRLVVPRAPFVHWALSRTSLRHLSPPWKLVSTSGMKMMSDDPYHTDWMLGAGLDLRDDYGHTSPVTKAATREMFRIQEELGSFEAAVLVDHGAVHGEVGKEILVLPNLSPAYAEDALKTGVLAIIAEVGGALAHLATVGRERGWTIMRVPDAMTRYPEGTRLTMDPKNGTVEIGTRLTMDPDT